MRNIQVMVEYLNEREITEIYGKAQSTARLLTGIRTLTKKYSNYPMN